VPFERLQDALGRADIVIASTASTEFVVDRPMVERAVAARPKRPLLLIDIAVPRDIDPAVRDVPGVHLYDIDGLQDIADANINLRRQEVTRVEEIVDEEVERFGGWLRSLEVVPTVASLRSRAEEVRAAELERTLPKMKLSAADRKRIEAMTSAIVKKLLHAPIAQLKTAGEGERYVEPVRTLFGLDAVSDDEPVDSEDA
jgi:glutamyl-tRNA reductase